MSLGFFGSSNELIHTATAELFVRAISMLHFLVFSVFWGSSLKSRAAAEWLITNISLPLTAAALLHDDHEGFVSTRGSYCGSDFYTCRNRAMQMDEFQQDRGSFFQFSAEIDLSTHLEMVLLKC